MTTAPIAEYNPDWLEMFQTLQVFTMRCLLIMLMLFTQSTSLYKPETTGHHFDYHIATKRYIFIRNGKTTGLDYVWNVDDSGKNDHVRQLNHENFSYKKHLKISNLLQNEVKVIKSDNMVLKSRVSDLEHNSRDLHDAISDMKAQRAGVAKLLQTI